MKKIILTLLTGFVLLSGCQKEILYKDSSEPCELQIANPTGRTYSTDSVVNFNCTSKHCGIIPLSSKNYWIYEDSVFNDGIFEKVQYDTLRFLSNKITYPDEIVWWQSSINIGLPDLLYANDSTFFGLEDRLFTPGFKDVKKEFGLFEGDSVKYLTSFEDAAAIGRSLKVEASINTPVGKFQDYLYFEKYARNYRKDQVFYKPGIGVIKYVSEKAKMGERVIKPERILTLMSYHIE